MTALRSAPRPRWLRYGLIGLAVLLTLFVVTAGGVAVWLATADLKPIAERLARKAVGRPLTIETLRISWGRSIGFELAGVHLPNAEWSQHPEMLQAGRVTGMIDAWSLLETPRVTQLRIDGFNLRLERGPERVGNWRFDGKTPAETEGEDRPPIRDNFPFLLDFTLTDGHITYRTTGGSELLIDTRTLSVKAPDADTPIRLAIDGAYGRKPVKLDGTLGTYRQLRDKTVPFPTDLTAVIAAGTLRLQGTMTRPLDFEGVDAALHGEIRDVGALIDLFGSKMALPIPLTVDTHFTHAGDEWRLADIKGTLADMPVTGGFALKEGKPGTPDAFDVALDFDRLEIARLAPKSAAGGGPTALRPDLDSPVLTAALTARRLSHRGQNFGDVAIKAKQAPGLIEIEQLHFALWGGRGEVRGKAEAVDGKPAVLAGSLHATGLDAGAVLRFIGAPPGELSGQVDAAASLTATGDTLSAALATTRGDMAITMPRGQIATTLLEKASADLRALFRREAGMTPIECFAAVMQVRDGIGTIQPLRLQTAGATFNGAGAIDLAGQRIDLTVSPERETTGTFALDIPIRLSGPLDDIGFGPGQRVAHSAPPRMATPLTGPTRALVARNACAH